MLAGKDERRVVRERRTALRAFLARQQSFELSDVIAVYDKKCAVPASMVTEVLRSLFAPGTHNCVAHTTESNVFRMGLDFLADILEVVRRCL